jgi:Tfp pilus assembly protein PilF
MEKQLDIRGAFKKIALSPYFWIIVAGLGVYFRALFYGYTFDDGQLIINNRHYLGDWHNILAAFTKNPYWNTNLSYYRPLLTLSFMHDFMWGGTNPFFYHFSNIVYHLAGCCLLYLFLITMGNGRKSAICWTLIFTVHPLFSQAVAWIPGRNDSLLAVFSLASVIMLIWHARSGKFGHMAGILMFFILALLTKETAVLLPSIFLLLWFIIRGKEGFGVRILLMSTIWFLTLAGYLFIRRNIFGFQDISLYGIRDCIIGLLSYMGKILLPVNLSVMPVNTNINIYYGLVATAAGIAAIAIGRVENQKFFGFGLLWMLIFLLPGFVSVTDFPHFLEHRFYLPAAGFVMAFSQVKLPSLGKIFRVRGYMVSYALVLLAFASVTLIHIPSFKDSDTFWGNAVRTSPDSYFVHYMMGLVHYHQNELDRAEEEFIRAVQIKPDSKWTYDNLAKIYEHQGRITEAERQYFKAIDYHPEDPLLHNNYGIFLMNQKQWAQAEREFIRAKELITERTKPQDCGVIYYNLALLDVIYLRWVNARDNLLSSLACSNYDTRTLELLANVYYRLGEMQRAGEYYAMALKRGLAPDKEVLKMLHQHIPDNILEKYVPTQN